MTVTNFGYRCSSAETRFTPIRYILKGHTITHYQPNVIFKILFIAGHFSHKEKWNNVIKKFLRFFMCLWVEIGRSETKFLALSDRHIVRPTFVNIITFVMLCWNLRSIEWILLQTCWSVTLTCGLCVDLKLRYVELGPNVFHLNGTLPSD